MRIAVPAQNGQLNPHFGQTTSFEIIDVDDTARSITARRTLSVDGCGGCGELPAILRQQDVTIVICGGLGQGAKMNLERLGLRVISGAPVGDAAELVRALVEGTLQSGDGVCDHGHGHEHEHAHGHHHAHQHRHGQHGIENV